MSPRKISTGRTALAILAIAGSLCMEAAAPAQAQGIFDQLFGGFRRMAPPPAVRGYAPERDPVPDAEEMRPRRLGAAVTYCVRLCDGRYFPVPRQSGVDAKDICNSFCPAAQTAIYSGGGIDYAVAPNGKRYADLPNAYLYRDKIVDNCSCNGKSPLGLARADPTDDPTLRTGDIVATNDGLKAVTVSRRGETQFTAIDKSKIYGEMRRRLSEVKVAPASRMTDGVAAED